jgi:hypothetical protein
LQRWCEHGGYEDGAEPEVLDVSVPTKEVIGAFASFLRWYADGRRGDPNARRKGGRKVSVCVLGGKQQTGA